MSMHSFDPEIAAIVGVVPAVLYQNIVYWTMRNAAEEEREESGKPLRHFHEGRWWTFNSVRALALLFSYLTPDQIRRALEKLEEAGLVAVGNFHSDRYNRAKWYSPLRQSDLSKMPNQPGRKDECTSGKNAESSTDINTDINTDDSSSPDGDAPSKPIRKRKPYPEAYEQLWQTYPLRAEDKTAKADCFKHWNTAVKEGADPDAIVQAAEAYRRAAGKDEYRKGLKAWLRNRAFELPVVNNPNGSNGVHRHDPNGWNPFGVQA